MANLDWFVSEVKKSKAGDFFEKKGMAWFSREIRKSVKDPNYQTFSIAEDPFIGGMFFFLYDPKTADKLPYWDKFPLVIPIEMYPDGFLGLNLHYLPFHSRQLLLSSLSYNYKVGKDINRYMKLSYKLLKTAAKSRLISPCIKRYLTTHMQSRLVKVDPDDWDNAIKLPVANWQKSKPY